MVSRSCFGSHSLDHFWPRNTNEMLHERTVHKCLSRELHLSMANLVAARLEDGRSEEVPLTWARGAEGAEGGVDAGRRLSDRAGALTDEGNPFGLPFSGIVGVEDLGCGEAIGGDAWSAPRSVRIYEPDQDSTFTFSAFFTLHIGSRFFKLA